MENNLLPFSQKDEKENVCRQLISLYEGLRVNIYMDDTNDQGNRDDLVGTGYVTANKTGIYPHTKWCCQIDEKGIWNQSNVK